MIESVIEVQAPAAVAAERFSDAPESSMFPIEAAAVADASPERRREFGTVRLLARQALLEIGMPAGPVLPDTDGAPRWPSGVVGSMTHTVGYRAAAVARAREVRSIGIDAEPHDPLPAGVRDLVLRDEERARLRALAHAHPDLHWDRILFSAKEAFYKAWFPLTRRWLDFGDVSAIPRPDGTFWAHVPGPGAADLDAPRASGRWMVERDLVIAATVVTL
jgi:4'-phosphopantetheinyl transferase EntD